MNILFSQPVVCFIIWGFAPDPHRGSILDPATKSPTHTVPLPEKNWPAKCVSQIINNSAIHCPIVLKFGIGYGAL